MRQYRIRGWFRYALDTESILRFEAKDDEEAWNHDLPPKFLLNALEREDDGVWVMMELAPEQFLAAISGVVTGIVFPRPASRNRQRCALSDHKEMDEGSQK